MDSNQHSALIDALGGTAKVARLCRVSPQAVSKWRKSGIPPARLMYLKLVCKEVFSASEEKQAVKSQTEATDAHDLL